jgi:hypothetical protein
MSMARALNAVRASSFDARAFRSQKSAPVPPQTFACAPPDKSETACFEARSTNSPSAMSPDPSQLIEELWAFGSCLSVNRTGKG